MDDMNKEQEHEKESFAFDLYSHRHIETHEKY